MRSPWHADFLLRPATLLVGQWTGDLLRLCGRTFDWAEVLPFLKAQLVTEVTGHGVTLSRRQPHAQRRTAYLLNAESTPESHRRLEAALRDADVYGLFVQGDESHKTFWSSLADFTMFRQWFPLGEWKRSSLFCPESAWAVLGSPTLSRYPKGSLRRGLGLRRATSASNYRLTCSSATLHRLRLFAHGPCWLDGFRRLGPTRLSVSVSGTMWLCWVLGRQTHGPFARTP